MISANPRPPAQFRGVELAQLLSTILVAWLLWSVLCVVPNRDWNGARLFTAALLGSGKTIYFLPGQGPALGWIYGPVWPLLLSPATWLPDLTSAMVAAGCLNAALLMGPVLLMMRNEACLAGILPAGRRWLLLSGAALMLCVPWLHGSLIYIHVDSAAVGLALISCWILWRSDPQQNSGWLAALFAVLAIWSKQIAVGVPLAQLIWLATRGEWRRAVHYGVQFGFVGLGVTALFCALFGPKELWHTIWSFPSHQTFRGGWSLVAREGWRMALSCLPFLVSFVLLRDRKQVDRGFLLLVLVAVVETPLALLSACKVGGGPNSFHPIYYALAASAFLIVWSNNVVGQWLKRHLAIVAGVSIALAALAVKQREGWHRVPALTMVDYLQVARSAPGEVYFPDNPLVTWWSERKIYHYEYGYLEQMTAGYFPDDARTLAWLPPRVKFVVYSVAAPQKAMVQVLAGFDRSVDLPGFTVYLRGNPGEEIKPTALR